MSYLTFLFLYAYLDDLFSANYIVHFARIIVIFLQVIFILLDNVKSVSNVTHCLDLQMLLGAFM